MATAIQEKQLAQGRANDTSTHSLYSPAASTTTIIKNIVIANTSSSAANIRIFLDDDGTTYTQATALMYDVPVSANSTVQLEGFFAMNNSSGNLAYQQGTANACTVTVFGAEIT